MVESTRVDVSNRVTKQSSARPHGFIYGIRESQWKSSQVASGGVGAAAPQLRLVASLSLAAGCGGSGAPCVALLEVCGKAAGVLAVRVWRSAASMQLLVRSCKPCWGVWGKPWILLLLFCGRMENGESLEFSPA